MSSPTLSAKTQTVAIISESITLLLMSIAQYILVRIHKKDEKTIIDDPKVFSYFCFCIFGFNTLTQIVFALLKNQKRTIFPRVLVRAVVFTLVIVNIVENQIISSQGLNQKFCYLALACSCVSVYVLGIIRIISNNEGKFKKILVCLLLLYFSLRISIHLQSPVLAVYTSLLCIIIGTFLFFVERVEKEESLVQRDRCLELFILRGLLDEVEDSFVILEDNNSVFYSNKKAFETLNFASDNIAKGLKRIKRYDTLSIDRQTDIRDKIFEAFEEKDNCDLKFGRTILSTPNDANLTMDQGFGDRDQSPNQCASHLKPFKTLFSSSSNKKKRQLRTAATSGEMSNSKGTFLLKHSHSKVQRANSKFKPMISLINNGLKSHPELLNTENIHEERPSYETNEIQRANDKATKENGVNDDAIRIQFEEANDYIFREISDNLKNLFNWFNMRNIPQINSNSSLEQFSKLKISEKYSQEHVGFINNIDNQPNLLNIKLQPLFIDNYPLLIIRLRENNQAEYCQSLKKIEKDRASMLASVSHEFRTPLNCIITMLDIVEKFVSTELKVDYVEPASASAKLLLSLINDILDFSQTKAKTLRLNYSYFDLKQHSIDILKLMEIQAKGKGVELKLEYDERIPPTIYSEPNRLRQVIINLLSNALKFTFQGSVALKIRCKERHVYHISVSDTGVGIKSENQKGLFRQFTRVSETHSMNQNGVGLGLSISNMLVKMLSPNNQAISLDSKYGVGTTFSFDLESKVYLDLNRDMDSEIVSDDEEPKNVLEKINTLKQQYEITQNQQKKMFDTKKPINSPLLNFLSDSMNLSIFSSSQTKEVSSSYRNQRKEKEVEDSSNRIYPKSSRTLNLNVPYTKIITAQKFKAELVQQKSHHTIISGDDRNFSMEFKGSFVKSRTLFEEKEFIKNMDVNERTIQDLSNKLELENLEEPCMLVVDDNAFNIVALTKILEGLNFRIDSATSGDIAIQKILEREKKRGSNTNNYRLIFMDCNMPIKSGYETTQEIRDLEAKGIIPKTSIIAVTGSTCQSEVRRCHESGMDDYIPKPINFDIIKSILIKYLKDD